MLMKVMLVFQEFHISMFYVFKTVNGPDVCLDLKYFFLFMISI